MVNFMEGQHQGLARQTPTVANRVDPGAPSSIYLFIYFFLKMQQLPRLLWDHS
jgi:hypothetical protein